jgi:hypothetical protein
MKNPKLFSAAALTLALAVASCGNDVSSEKGTAHGETNVVPVSEVPPGALNFVDRNGKYQGHWILTGNMVKDSLYMPDAKVEEGWYKNGQKDSVWTTFNPDGSVKATVMYENGVEVK